MARTNEEWEQAISQKIIEVQSLTGPGPAAAAAAPPTPAQLAAAIDNTLLKPDATPAQIDALCDQALQFGFKSCCVNGVHIPQVARRLAGSTSIPCCVVGFPLGAASSASKAFETTQAIADGAQEIDMVLDIGALKARLYTRVFADAAAVVAAARGRAVKAIVETALLTDGEKVAAAFVAAEAGAAFVKTCTGFAGGAAEARDVGLMWGAVQGRAGAGVRVKASAGIRSYARCVEMLRAGAERIGTSSSVVIMEEAAAAQVEGR